MKRYKLNVSKSVINYLERLWYEDMMCKENIAFLIRNSSDNPAVLESPAFKRYEEKQIATRVSYEEAKAEFTDRYIPDVFKQHKANWEANFRDEVVIITQTCDCEIDISGIEGVEIYEN